MGMSNPSPSSFVGECLSWDLSFFNNCTNEDEDSEILTALVRTSYMNHLQRSLVKNYEHWLDSNKDSDDLDCSKEDILKCAKFLEHKALRACMVASYYQRAMVKTMKEIKKSTEEGSLFSPLIEHVFDNKIKNRCEKGTQTSISLTNCKVESPELSEDILQMRQTKETSTIDITLENSNVIIFKPCTTDKCEKDKGNNDLEDLFNILMTSPNFSDKNESEKIPSPKKRKYEEESIENVINLDSVNESNDLTDSSFIGEKNNSSNLEERLQKFAMLFGEDESNSNSKTLENTNESLNMKSLNSTIEDLSSNYDNDSMIVEDNAPFKLALDWKSEYAAQNCNLKCILNCLDPSKRAKVQRKFKELFGIDKPMNLDISLTEAALSRKRTANLVVGALTPHYLAGKIASRNVFKSLAKKITDDILVVTNVAGLEEVTDKVNAYFENGRCVNSEKDILNA
ncbi:TNF receptor-associated factor family protein DDB_G0272098 [Halyomorpha halys]|uniref:TNF receptor-associated factor family protein DDB_G0272098 n=1 Tax=Halyomorpha halys TaxID=286706 RepID=UPI0006D50689|nr:uncharacterized protein LOC106689779 [Halyomorpha halys]